MAKLFELGYELLPLQPYSTDLATSDYFQFPNLIEWLSGKSFFSNDDIIEQTNVKMKSMMQTLMWIYLTNNILGKTDYK